jgi:hypothetical protein
MKNIPQYQNPQKTFEESVKGLIEIKALPTDIIIYMYYAPMQHSKAECLSFTFRVNAPIHLKNEASRLALTRLRDGKNVSFINMTIALFAGTIENNKLMPLPDEDLDAIGLLLGGLALNLDQPIKMGNATKEMVEKYAVGLQLNNLGSGIKEMHRTNGYFV